MGSAEFGRPRVQSVRTVIGRYPLLVSACCGTVAAFCLSLSPRGYAQSNAREFEVVSIHVNQSGSQSYRTWTPPGEEFTATNVTLKALVLDAFNIKSFQL